MDVTNGTIRLLFEDVLRFHAYLGQYFVMSTGTPNYGLLESAINAPFQSFDGMALYPRIFDQAARLCFGIAKNHPFPDGNKRVALHAMMVFLDVNGMELACTDDELETIILDVVTNRMQIKELSMWLESRCTKTDN